MEAVADDGVEPVVEPCRGRCSGSDRHQRSGDEHARGREAASALAPEQEDDCREAGVERGLLDQHRDSGQDAREDEPARLPARQVPDERDE